MYFRLMNGESSLLNLQMSLSQSGTGHREIWWRNGSDRPEMLNCAISFDYAVVVVFVERGWVSDGSFLDD